MLVGICVPEPTVGRESMVAGEHLVLVKARDTGSGHSHCAVPMPLTGGGVRLVQGSGFLTGQ